MNWKDLVKGVAPVLGTALGGPYGGMAAKWLSSELLGDSSKSPDALEQAITNADPQTFAKIKELDQKFQEDMQKIGLSRDQLAVTDTQGARELFKTNIWPQIVLSCLYTFGYFAMVYVLLSGKMTIPATQSGIADGLILVMTTAQAAIMHFWFGSSLGSKEKTTLIGKQS